MYQGTTPTHTFTLPFDTTQLKEIKIVYEQDGKEVLTKRKADCKFEGTIAVVNLSQEETFLFSAYKDVEIQVRVLTNFDEALVSDIITVSVRKCLDREVLK